MKLLAAFVQFTCINTVVAINRSCGAFASCTALGTAPSAAPHLCSPRRFGSSTSSFSLFGSASTKVYHPFSTRIKMGKKDINSSPKVSVTNNDNPLARLSLPVPLILGSASFTRKLILRDMEIPFHVLVRPIDEKSIGDRSASDRPEGLVLMVARAKMDHLVDNISRGDCDDDLPATSLGDSAGVKSDQEFVIMTGDQVITCANRILEKPSSIEEAKQFVQMYSRNPPSTVGSVILTHLPSGITVEGTDKATIYFKESVGHATSVSTDGEASLEMDLVDRMLMEDAPILSCAGGLMIEHPLVREHIDHVDGTEDSVMGLSKALVLRLLGELKVKLDRRN